MDFFSKCLKFITVDHPYESMKEISHCCRVAAYVSAKDDYFRSGKEFDFVKGVALLHDYLEDTKASKVSDIPALDAFLETVAEEEIAHQQLIKKTKMVLERLTRKPDQSYDDYMQSIIHCDDPWVFVVKQADMRDHFAEIDTLTEKLRDKYLPYVSYFMR